MAYVAFDFFKTFLLRIEMSIMSKILMQENLPKSYPILLMHCYCNLSGKKLSIVYGSFTNK